MNLFRLERVTSSVLSFWLGFLACVLGCVQPILAAPWMQTPIPQFKAAANVDNEMADAGLCCHHSGSAPENNKHHTQTVSCCPLDATLTQKQDPVSPLRIDSSLTAFIQLAFQSLYQFSASSGADPAIVWHAGRDVLLKAHVLRI
jgi:hypothetical protein